MTNNYKMDKNWYNIQQPFGMNVKYTCQSCGKPAEYSVYENERILQAYWHSDPYLNTVLMCAKHEDELSDPVLIDCEYVEDNLRCFNANSKNVMWLNIDKWYCPKHRKLIENVLKNINDYKLPEPIYVGVIEEIKPHPFTNNTEKDK
jgi:hypothetical protein